MSDDTTPTPLSQQAAEPVEPPKSWTGPIRAVEKRVTELETSTAKALKDLSDKTDLQNVTLGRIEGLLTAALKGAAKSPMFRYVVLLIFGGVVGWLKAHGFKVPFFEDNK